MLRWDFNEKCGEAILHDDIQDKDFTLNLYQGNAYLIFLSEWKEDGKDMYSLHSFWADRDHAKILLGLKKNNDGEMVNIYDNAWGQTITKFRFNKKMRNFDEIVRMVAKAFDNIDIEIYKEV